VISPRQSTVDCASAAPSHSLMRDQRAWRAVMALYHCSCVVALYHAAPTKSAKSSGPRAEGEGINDQARPAPTVCPVAYAIRATRWRAGRSLQPCSSSYCSYSREWYMLPALNEKPKPPPTEIGPPLAGPSPPWARAPELANASASATEALLASAASRHRPSRS